MRQIIIQQEIKKFGGGMVVNTKKLDELVEHFGKDYFTELYNIFLEEVSEIVEGMRNSILNNDIAAFQGWAHRGKTTAGTFGIKHLSNKLDYFAHCNPGLVTMERAKKLIDHCEKEFILAIDEINDYIRTH